MFERFTERARRVLFYARYEASQLGSITIETAHLVLGLIRENEGPASRIIARRYGDTGELRRAIESRVVFRERLATSVEIPFSVATKRALQSAVVHADQLKTPNVDDWHLLLGVLQNSTDQVTQLLNERGVTLVAVRDELAAMHDLREEPEADGTAWYVPDYLPSDTVHISYGQAPVPFHEATPTWVAGAHDFRELVGLVCGVHRARVVEEDGLHHDDRRYDVVVKPRPGVGPDRVTELVRLAIEAEFKVTLTREDREGVPHVIVRPSADR